MSAQIVNADPKYPPVELIEPTTLGYLHLAAEVHARPGPFMPHGREKSELLHDLKDAARRLAQHDAVVNTTVYDAVGMPPLRRLPYVQERGRAVRLATYDVAILIETTSPTSARDVQSAPAYRTLRDVLAGKAKQIHEIVARNAKRMGDVDKTRKGLFVFNYFVADDPDVALALWDHLAGWYTAETGVDNSTLLVPLEDQHSDYVAINHARWDLTLPEFLFRQLSKRSFRSFVLANLKANHVGAMPVLYRLA